MNPVILILATFLIFLGTHAANAQGFNWEDDALFARCEPMELAVEQLHEDAGKIGLTLESIRNAAESRIRAMRMLKKGARRQVLYVRVSVFSAAFNADLSLQRWVPDLGFGRGGLVEVWDTALVGTHGGSSQFILGKVSRLLDVFLTKYLRANEEACAKK